jgi:hypothetical protein
MYIRELLAKRLIKAITKQLKVNFRVRQKSVGAIRFFSLKPLLSICSINFVRTIFDFGIYIEKYYFFP